MSGPAANGPQAAPARRLAPWRVAARLARREIRRHWARSVLVVVIVALPVLAAQAAAINQLAVHLHEWAPRDPSDVPRSAYREPQSADADRRVGFDPRLGRPGDSRAERIETGFSVLDWTAARPGHGVGPDDLLRVQVVGFIPEVSSVPVARGDLPQNRHEAVISSGLAEDAGLGLGDRLGLLGSDVALEVVGVARPGTTAARDLAWAGPPPTDADPADPAADWVVRGLVEVRPTGTPFVTVEMYALFWFPRQTPPPPVAGPAPRSPAVPSVPSDPATLMIAAVGAAIAVGFVATVCSAAFAIGARRQLRGLGTLAATGATPGDLVRAVLLQGTTLGLVGAAAATVLALGGRVLVLSLIDDGWAVPWAIDRVLAVALLGVAAGTLAALVPALTASRIPTLSALAGRAPARRRRLRSPYVGAGLVLVGLGVLSRAAGSGNHRDTAAAAAAAVGVLLVMAGAVALSPGVVAGLARLCARRRGTTRLAGRSLVRSGSRSAAVVASTAVAVAIPVVLLVWGARIDGPALDTDPISVERREAARQATGLASISDLGTGADRGRVTAEARRLMGPHSVTGRVVVVSDERGPTRALAVDVEALRRASGSDAVVRALAAGEVVLVEGADDIRWEGAPTPETALDIGDRTVRTVAAAELPDVVVRMLDGGTERLVADDLATGVPTTGAVQVVRPGALAASEAERLQDLGSGPDPIPTRALLSDLEAAGPVPPAIEVQAHASEALDDHRRELPVELLVVLGAILLALAVTGTASALAAADGRSDEQVIAAVGAPPSTVHRRRTLEALLTAVGATVLGTGLGAVATLVVIHHPLVAEDGLQPAVSFPFLAVGATAAGIVLAVGTVTWLALALGRLRGRRDIVLVDA